MATIFVSSVDGDNADDGSTWSLAKATVAGALAIASSGDVIKVSHVHAYTASAAITWTMPTGNIAIISVDRSNGDAYLAGATESIGAATNLFSFTVVEGSSLYSRGITFNSGTVNNTLCRIEMVPTASANALVEFVNCTFDVKSANAFTQLNLGASTSGGSRSLVFKLISCSFITSGSRAGSMIGLGDCNVEIVDPTFSTTGATKPTSLFAARNIADNMTLLIRDGDLTGYAVSGGSYFLVTSIAAGHIVGENLKLSATPALVGGTWNPGESDISLRNCDTGHGITSFDYLNAYGTLTDSVSVYADSSAAFAGVGVSWTITTTSICSENTPFYLPLAIWGTTLTSQTASVEIVADNATSLTDREFWLELSYPASGSFTNYAVGNDRNTVPFLGTPVDQASSSVSWTGTGGYSNLNKQKAEVAFTAADVGLIKGKVAIAKASVTLNVDPRLRGVT